MVAVVDARLVDLAGAHHRFGVGVENRHAMALASQDERSVQSEEARAHDQPVHVRKHVVTLWSQR